MHRQKHSWGIILVMVVAVGGMFFGLTGCDDNGGVQNQPPQLNQIADQSVTEGQTLTINVTATDPDNDALELGIQNPPTNSLFVDNEDGTGEFTFNPNFTQEGNYQPVFVVSDGSMEAMDTVSIQVVDEAFIHHSGVISEDETWSAGDSPHLVAGDIEVQDGAVLTIEDITIYFVTGKRIRVGYNGLGGLRASNATFTPISGNPGPGKWDGISFAGQTLPGSYLDNCVIEYGGGNGFGNVFVSDGAISITDCTIRYSETDGVHFIGDGHATSFSGNVIQFNSRYPATIPANYLGGLRGSSLLGNTRDTIKVVGTTVSQDSEWDTLGVPLTISERFEVNNEATLTIVPGLTIAFDQQTGIDVGLTSAGHLQANGTAEKPIRFVPNSAPATAGDWEGILFGPFAGSANSLDHCEVLYGAETNEAAVSVYDSEVSITNSTISSSNLHGVYFEGTGRFSAFSGNVVDNCTGFPIIIPAQYAGGFVAENEYSNNGSQQIGLSAGTITDIQTWANLSIPYLVRNPIAVDNNGELTIAPGTTIEFRTTAGITVGESGPATLIADGSGDMITFTSTAEPQTWVGIRFMSNATTDCLLDSCVVDYAGTGNAGAVMLTDCQVRIRETMIQNGGADGIRFEGAAYALDFEGNTITGNSGAPVAIDADFVGRISPDNDYSGNSTDAFKVGGSELTSDATWANPGVPFIVENMVNINNGVSLTLSAGLELRFEFTAGFMILQGGALIADGTEGTIQFLSNGVSWPGLVFKANSSSASVLKSCLIQDAGRYSALNIALSQFPGSVYLENTHIAITDCEILGSAAYGIFLHGNAYIDEFSGNSIRGAGAPVRVDASAAGRLTPGNFLESENDNLAVVEVGGDATINDNAERIGKIRSDATWADLGVPYYAADSIWVGSGATWTLEPGVTITVNSLRSITVGGQIGEATVIAQGTPDQRIEINLQSSRQWGAFTLVGSANDASILENCYFNEGGRNRCGMLKVVDCSPTIQDNEFGKTNGNSCKICLVNSSLDPVTLENNNSFTGGDAGDNVCQDQ